MGLLSCCNEGEWIRGVVEYYIRKEEEGDFCGVWVCVGWFWNEGGKD